MPHTRVGFTVEATAAAVRSARHRVSAAVRSWGVPCDGDMFPRLELVVSELLTNGLLHADGPMTVEVALEQGLLVVGVLDGSPALPQPREAEAGDERGRGLALVDALCLLRGAEPTASGKRCWAVLPVAAAPGPADGGSPGGAQDDGVPVDSARWSVTPAGTRLLSILFPAP
ncbi:ATP-binding protein [Streptomyces sp. NPDC059506]|uniref:ATP-binding protein n=1 Tax=unclassified Streptomyces TaxID=2593676 RepID=UPI000CAEC6DB|nr:ATP-binding protein [Streptomyces sp. SCUT-3]PLW62963.1 ATP-binding protein [Streptomyces sp. DJ]QMV20735.1 ATP-binding protein [Streptomyces sp. SCUT-3]